MNGFWAPKYITRIDRINSTELKLYVRVLIDASFEFEESNFLIVINEIIIPATNAI